MPVTHDTASPIAASPAMRTLFDTVEKIAQAVVPVLVLGETGTGKEVVAHEIHRRGPRSEAPFGCLNCGGLSPQLVESTLFGYERGAFTGAMQRSRGIFEASHAGTVLLDEIGELPLEAQASLLRVLETKRLTRVGATEEIEVDVRIVAATHRDLEAMCRQGAFRWDLYYRLNVITLEVPPLRARPDDVVALADRFAQRAAEDNSIIIHGIRAPALEVLRAYDWPGNVRELKNTMERAVVVTSDGWIDLEQLPTSIGEGGQTIELDLRAIAEASEPTQTLEEDGPSQTSAPEEIVDFKTQMALCEIDVIIRALDAVGHNQSEASRRLKMPLRTLVHKMKVHDIRRIIAERNDAA